MCKKLQYCNRQVDFCIKSLVNDLQTQGFDTILSCCGHGKYEPTIVIRNNDNSVFDFFTKKLLNNYNPNFDKRHNTYYKKDSDGYYFIPEIFQLIKSKI